MRLEYEGTLSGAIALGILDFDKPGFCYKPLKDGRFFYIKDEEDSPSKKEQRSYSYHRKTRLQTRRKELEMCLNNETRWLHGSPKGHWDWEQNKYIYTGTYLRKPDMSKRKSFLKKQSARKIRRTEDAPQRCGSQKLFNYWWELI